MESLSFATDLDAGKQDELDRKFYEQKKQKASAKSAADPKNVYAEASPALRRAVGPPPKLDKKESELLVRGRVNVEAEAKVKVQLLHTYEAYYSKEELKGMLPKKLALTVHHKSEDILAALNAVRMSLNTHGSVEHIRSIYPKLVEMVIKLLAVTGMLEQMGLEHAAGAGEALGRTLRDPVASQCMQTELAEMEVELRMWFAQPWYSRMVMKTYLFVKAYSDGEAMKHKRASPAAQAAAASLAK
jgi:hypothetical protein